MKNILFKSVCLMLLCCGAALTANAQGIKVIKKDGTVVYYKASEVESVGVYGYGEEPEPTISGKDSNGRAWVDLGLPSGTKWAICNVGANEPEDYGDYFAWGETTGYKDGKTMFSWSTYKYCDGSYNTMTKYCMQSSDGSVDNKSELEPMDDAATVNWGSGWQMPSVDQCEELINSNYTTTTWTAQNGVNGRLIKSKSNGNSIFLPAAGWCDDTGLSNVGSIGYYWSRSLKWTSYCAYAFSFSSSYIRGKDYFYHRSYGKSVRPVRVKE